MSGRVVVIENPLATSQHFCSDIPRLFAWVSSKLSERAADPVIDETPSNTSNTRTFLPIVSSIKLQYYTPFPAALYSALSRNRSLKIPDVLRTQLELKFAKASPLSRAHLFPWLQCCWGSYGRKQTGLRQDQDAVLGHTLFPLYNNDFLSHCITRK